MSRPRPIQDSRTDPIREFPDEIDGTVAVSGEDIDRLNGLQLQAADRCLIVSPGTRPERMQRLHERFGGLRKPLDDLLREIQADHLPEGAVLVIGSNVSLPEPLDGWRIRENPHVEGDGYRNLAWTEYCENVVEEFEKDSADMNTAIGRAEAAMRQSTSHPRQFHDFRTGPNRYGAIDLHKRSQ